MAEISVTQCILPHLPPKILCFRYNRRSAGTATKHLTEKHPNILGMAINQSAHGSVECLALATLEVVIVISKDVGPHHDPEKCFEDLLNGQAGIYLAAFGMEKLAVHLCRDWMLPGIRGVDLSTLCSKSTMNPLRPSTLIESKLFSEIAKSKVDNMFASFKDVQNLKNLCLRAWISAHVANSCATEISSAAKIDTRNLQRNEVVCLSELMVQSCQVESIKPQKVANEFEFSFETKDGDLAIRNARYSNRVRNKTSVIMTNSDGKEYIGRAAGVNGKTTTVKLKTGHFSGVLQSVVAIGGQEATNAEKARDEFILLALQGERDLSSDLIRILWFPTQDVQQLRARDITRPLVIDRKLNASQREVVAAMVSTFPTVVVVHGPPGTGKTTTISAAAKIWDEDHSHTWIVANSNVAVKNIAESMFRKGVDFKIIVSKEFYVEWHEHIYSEIEDRLVRSDELPDDIRGVESMMRGSCIVLSTMSMLSNPILEQSGAFKLVPMVKLIVDEASQINVFDFMHLFGRFTQLKKVCFFGDPKQLPPHGQNEVPSLQSVFDIPHLRAASYLLNIQYRMPTPLGEFISRQVYDNKLQSEHEIKTMSCVSFVDASKGEEMSAGFSWKNLAEVQTIVHLVRHYYQARDFCIITPYDAQRAEIEKQLKAEGLPWERVFNVDSFQGSEAHFVLFSVVRTSKPGFLNSLNRMNVGLTRCKTGMVVVTNRAFLLTHGRDTLLGRLSHHWQTEYGMSMTWVDWKAVAEGKAILPPYARAQANQFSPSPPSATPRTSEHTMTPWKIALHPTLAQVDQRQREQALPGSDSFPPLPVCGDVPKRNYARSLGMKSIVGGVSWSSIAKSRVR